MSTTVCSTCGKAFARAAQLAKHGERKRPCKPPMLAPAAAATVAFRPASVKFNGSLTKEVRQATGIYFTPKKARDLLFQTLSDLGITAPARILEPSFGTGEFLLDAADRYPGALFQGVEMNESLFKSLTLPSTTTATLIQGDFLAWSGTADLIIGNPPYFVMPATAETRLTATGRPNMYITFLYKCLEKHLEVDGHLAFIVPTSLYNCSYYQPMRDYMAAHTTIRHLESLTKPGFYETGQETTLIVLQKRKSSGDAYLFRPPSTGTLYISPDYEELRSLVAGSTTVGALGFAVKTGNVVWNQVKTHLTADPTGATTKLLIYSSNIKNSELCLNNLLGTEKKQYVKDLVKETVSGPLLLVERGYGNAFSFNTVLVRNTDFYAENHLNVVYPTSVVPPAELEARLARILASFKDPRTKRFVTLFNGNGTISGSDLETLIPIF